MNNMNDMSDQQIMQHAIDGGWPKEALPDQCYPFRSHGETFWSNHRNASASDGGGIEDDHAAALFRDSGLEWLAKVLYSVRMRAFHNTRYGWINIETVSPRTRSGGGDVQSHTGLTMLAAINNAVNATRTAP